MLDGKKMLSPPAIVIKSKTKGFVVSDWTIRKVSKDLDDDTGWRFQAILTNTTSWFLSDLEMDLRYFDSNGKFVGLDEGFVLGSDDLDSGDDKAISILINPPTTLKACTFTVKARKTWLLDRHSFLIFGALLLALVIWSVFA